MIGKTLGHYEITGVLGKGGMGEVFLARDTHLGRDVALKILPPEIANDPGRSERFRREALAVAALKHPNIVTLYSAEEADGIQFLTMELVEGGPLNQVLEANGMPLDKLFDLAIPIAQALASAHEKGITHRDLKPANILLDDEGRPKILDFGLAQMIQQAAAGDATVAIEPELTAAGAILGTAGYMAPEQAEGLPSDARADIFALGVILYEMACGKRPFAGENTARVISAILRDDPVPVLEVREDLPHHLGRIIKRCLEKDPKSRYQSARDLHNELRDLRQEITVERLSGPGTGSGSGSRRAPAASHRSWVPIVATAVIAIAVIAGAFLMRGRTGAPVEVSQADGLRIVVLPLENLGDPDDAFFADGMTEELTSRLSSVEGLGVISRKSAATYAGSDASVQQIGAELDVDYVLTGSVRWARSADGVQVRISPQLIRVTDDTQLWSSAYDRKFEDVFAIQSEIAREVIGELNVALTGNDSQELESVPTQSPAAYELYMRALAIGDVYDGPSLDSAVGWYEQAVAIDPEFARAWAELARARAIRIHFGYDVTPEGLEAARLAATRAVELAPDDARSHIAMGFFEYHALKNYEAAESAFARAAELRPNDPELLRGLALVQRRQGNWKESTRNLEAARVLNPRDVTLLLDLVDHYIPLAMWEKADEVVDACRALRPDMSVIYSLEAIGIMNRTGDLNFARITVDLANDPGYGWIAELGGFIETYSGNYDRALQRIAAANYPIFMGGATSRTGAVWRGLIYQLAGDEGQARGNLEFAVSQLSEIIATRGDAFRFESALGIVYAALGRRDEARAQARRALEQFPPSRDTTWGPGLEMDVAQIYTMIGDFDAAMRHAEAGLSGPSYWTATRMKLDPWLKPLTEQPGFEEMRVRAEKSRAEKAG